MNTRTIKKYYATQRRNRALLLALGGHIIAIIVIAIWLLKPLVEQEKDSIAVDFVRPSRQIHRPKPKVPEVPQNKAAASSQNPAGQHLTRISPISPTMGQPEVEPPPDATVVDLPPSDEADLSDNSPKLKRGSNTTDKEDTGPGQRRRSSEDGLGDIPQSSGTGQDAFGGGVSDIINGGGNGTGDEFGSHIDEEDGIVRGHISLIRLKHDLSNWWQDPTAITSLTKWLQEHVKTISTDMDYEGGALPLTDKRIMAAPLLIMTGHDQAMSVSYQRLAERNSQASGFSDAERAALRKYIIDYNGMLFFDYCGNGGNEKSFARLVENELRTVFPDYPLTTLNTQHEIFQCYFKLTQTPVGGSWFWETNYKGGNNKWRHIKGISVPGRFGKDRLAVVFCPLDYLCSMETAEIDSRAPLSARRSSDVYRFMTNMFVYQMRQRSDSK
ncbi:MAG: DUF4159 domain-containing protein [Candidatus Poribacteria bacterium]|nr:DUF4159 domain-containing protein [Candidatus Poribacteria bacterium]